jgi:hypothetical protein
MRADAPMMIRVPETIPKSVPIGSRIEIGEFPQKVYALPTLPGSQTGSRLMKRPVCGS